MRTLWKLAAAAGAAMLVAPLLGAATAGATPPTGYGFDNTPHVIVGGGSDTTWPLQIALTDLWDKSPGCSVVVDVRPTTNTCLTSGSPETNTLGNYQHDTVAQANPAGSSTGIASLNGFADTAHGFTHINYAGTVNPATLGTLDTPNVDFARSSRAAKTSGGNTTDPSGNELHDDTFWGIGQDGVEVALFNNRVSQVQGKAGVGALSGADLVKIWNCTYHKWSDIPALGIAPGSATDGPIVAWGLNKNSGTFGTFNSFLISQGAPSGFTVNDHTECVHALASPPAATGAFPLENDVKPILHDVQNNGISATTDNPAEPAGLSTNITKEADPENWIWFGSFGVLSSFSFDAGQTIGANTWTSGPSPVNGTIPSTSNIGTNTYPIGRTLYHVTRKTDADCPLTAGACDFTGNPGPALPAGGNDLNVTGASSGLGGAVREYTRFQCRPTAADQATDPFTGVNYNTEITSALGKSGFTVVPVALRNAGSRCHVVH